jgi:hypothetical protein
MSKFTAGQYGYEPSGITKSSVVETDVINLVKNRFHLACVKGVMFPHFRSSGNGEALGSMALECIVIVMERFP